ncbi:hypothetical protein J5U46_18185 [Micromonospora tulbaghiae]|uniref:DUF202 domain-containing protein n=1 Tax=Micromonospora tulbaghiae TaxID=479978 RepID=A0AAW4JJV4_9ACTN|nr:hypothetical protein [Micromonospora tulbaghiae]MBO4142087.1 hypothetical protein [Micromonospora tulbaghiae]
MADQTDVLIQQWLSRWEQIRHSENQRAAMTNIILALAAAGIGFISQKGLVSSVLIVSIALMLLGAFGAVSSAKYYERFRLHLREAGAIRARIDEKYPDLKLGELADSTWREQGVEFPRLSKMPLYGLWIALHLGILGSGALVSMLIVGRL